MSIFTLPDLGEGLQEAEIVAWHVAEGDHVVADQPLVSVETEKAVVEVPSPEAGRIARLLARPGERVKVGAPIVAFAEGAPTDTGTVVGELAEKPSPRPAALPEGKVLAAPGVRAFARERGVDLAKIVGSGPGRAVTRADVERAVTRADVERAVTGADAERAVTGADAERAVTGADVERAAVGEAGAPAGEPLKGVRRAMALNMARAHAEVVPATLWDRADVEPWWSTQADVSVRLVRAIGIACAAVPALNACYDGRSMVRRLMPRVDLGIAVDTGEGLIVPVLRDIGNRDAADLRRDLDALKAATRARSVALADLRDPTISLSNFGTLVGRQAALVVLPPQVAIVGAGRIAPEAVPRGEGAAFRHMLPLSLTFDHRVVTGGEAARFLAAMIEDLQQQG
jgi:2-oxoisovalerate dehydrogenase E2 component (dihydrolipoyl transacylase)